MNHIDQKTLELYALGDENTLLQREHIESHLAECAGCRELYERTQDLYAGFFDSMESIKQEPSDISLPIKTRRSIAVQHLTSPLQEIRSNYEIDHSPVRSVVSFVRKHPVVSSTISFFVLGFFGLLGLQVLKITENVDDNPSYYSYNSNNNLEVYNKENKLLWSLQSDELSNTKTVEKTQKINFTKIIDIDGDGSNEIVTTLDLESFHKGTQLINIFDKSGALLKSVTFQNNNIIFRKSQYFDNIHWGNFFSQKMTNGEINFFVLASTGRSPSLIVRMDSQFNIIGQYWHFGNFQLLRQSDIFNNGKMEIVLLGKNDVNDMKMKDFPIMIILDPEKLFGIEESSVTSGFGYSQTNSELYYIRFPETDMEKSLKVKTYANNITNDNAAILQINVSGSNHEPNSNFIGFDYIFNKKDMSVIDVKFVSETERTHKKLKNEGRIKSTFNQEYLKNLKTRVEYWNGNQWVKLPVKISPPKNILGAK